MRRAGARDDVGEAAEADFGFDVFDTEVLTVGVNYYVSDNVKVQFNYSLVDEEDGIDRDDRQFREVRNHMFLLNLQVGF